MSEDTTTHIDAKGLSFSWKEVFRLLGLSLPIVGMGVVLWLTTIFVTRQEMQAAVQQVSASAAPLPAKVQSLEEFKARQEKAQDRTTEKLEAIQSALAASNAIQQQQAQTTTRILDQLERLNRRADK